MEGRAWVIRSLWLKVSRRCNCVTGWIAAKCRKQRLRLPFGRKCALWTYAWWCAGSRGIAGFLMSIAPDVPWPAPISDAVKFFACLWRCVTIRCRDEITPHVIGRRYPARQDRRPLGVMPGSSAAGRCHLAHRPCFDRDAAIAGAGTGRYSIDRATHGRGPARSFDRLGCRGFGIGVVFALAGPRCGTGATLERAGRTRLLALRPRIQRTGAGRFCVARNGGRLDPRT